MKEICAGLGCKRRNLLNEGVPIVRMTAVETFGGADAVDSPGWAAEPLSNDALRETQRLLELISRDSIDLVDHEEHVPNVPSHLDDEGELVAGDGRIDSEDGDRGVDVGHELACRCGVLLEHRSYTGGVDETHSGGEQGMGRMHLRPEHTFGVVRIPVLGDERPKLGRIDLVPGIVREPDPGPKFAAVTDDGDDGRERNDAHWEQGPAEQGIEKGGFAALVLADAGEEESPFLDAGCEYLGLRGDRRDFREVAQPRDSHKRAVPGGSMLYRMSQQSLPPDDTSIR